MITDTQALAEMQAEHAAKAADLAAQIGLQRAEAHHAREARLLAWDQAAVDRYAEEDEQVRAEEAHWRAEWRKAVLADPVIGAWIRYRAARWRRTYRQATQEAAIQRTGSDLRPPPMINYASPLLFEDTLDLAEAAARGLAQDEQDALYEARESAGDGSDDDGS